MINERLIAVDITFLIETPGVPVQIRYRHEYYDGDTGAVISSETLTDCRATPEDVRKYLGDSLAAGREEEQRALVSEQSAIARAEKAEAERDKSMQLCDDLRDQLALAMSDRSKS